MVTQETSREVAETDSLSGRLQDLLHRLLSPVDIASLVFFGVIAFWHVWLQMPCPDPARLDTRRNIGDIVVPQ